MRNKKLRTDGRVSAALGYALLSLSAHLGGKLVYERRVGVDRTDGEVFPKTFVAVLAESELADSTPTRAAYDGTPILLVRRGDSLFAMRKRARISAAHCQKVNWSGIVLFARIMPLDLHSTMDMSSTGQPYIHSLRSRSALETAKSKCVNDGRTQTDN